MTDINPEGRLKLKTHGLVDMNRMIDRKEITDIVNINEKRFETKIPS
jgi:hypothetical protein